MTKKASEKPALIWSHGNSTKEALAKIKAAIEESGYSDDVKWEGNHARVKKGPLGSLLHAEGEVQSEHVVLKKCTGLIAAAIRKQCREMLETLFPGGEGQ
jgi:hypothetical protein